MGTEAVLVASGREGVMGKEPVSAGEGWAGAIDHVTNGYIVTTSLSSQSNYPFPLLRIGHSSVIFE